MSGVVYSSILLWSKNYLITKKTNCEANCYLEECEMIKVENKYNNFGWYIILGRTV